MGELTPNVQVALIAVIGVIIAAIVAAVPPTVATLLTAKQAAGERKAAALVVASKVAEVAAATVEVKAETAKVKEHLEQTTTQTTGKLDKIHDLVNNTYSEQLKLTEALAEMLLAENPASEKYQLIAERARAAVVAHRPAESTAREEKNG
jgi:hypothetical protein